MQAVALQAKEANAYTCKEPVNQNFRKAGAGNLTHTQPCAKFESLSFFSFQVSTEGDVDYILEGYLDQVTQSIDG